MTAVPYEAFFKLDTGTHTDDIVQIAATADGRTLVSAGECTILVWDLKTRQLQRRLLGPVSDRVQERYGNGNVGRFALSPDGRWVVALKNWGNQPGPSDAGQITLIEVFELATGNLQAGFRYPGPLFDLDFSPDGRQLALAGNASHGERRHAVVMVCATRDLVHGGYAVAPRGVVVQAIADAALRDELAVAVRFIPDASSRKAPYRLVAAAQRVRGKAGTLAWCSFTSAHGLRADRSVRTEAAIDPMTLAVSHAYAVVAAELRGANGPGLGRLLCHDHDGRQLSSTPTDTRPASVSFSRSGAQLLVGLSVDRRGHVLVPTAGDQTVQVNAYDTGLGGFTLRSSYYGHDDSIGALAWLADGTAVSAGGDNQAIQVWSPGHRVGEPRGAIRGVGQTYYAPGIDADEKISFGTVPQRLLPPNHPPRQQSFDLRSLGLASAASDVKEADFESDKWLLLALDPIRTLPLRSNQRTTEMNASPDLTLFVGTDDEWVIWSRSGYYASSADGARRVGYHVSRGRTKEALHVPADRFKAFNRPDLIRAIVQHGGEDAAREAGVAIPPVDVASLLPPIVEFARHGVVAGPEQVSLSFSVEALIAGQPVTRVWILRNDRFVWAELEPSTRPLARYKATLRLGPGRQVFSIHAETAVAKAVPLTIELQGPEPTVATAVEASASGNLYLLSVGVSDFAVAGSAEAGEFQRLKYAHKDAIAVHNAFATSRRSNRFDPAAKLRNPAFDAVEATLLLNESATKVAILRELDRLCARIRQRSQADGAERDVLMVFLSGHGVRFKGEPDLYFWNHDLRPSALEATGLSMLELGERITSVAAEVVLVIDACHAGMAGGNVMSGLDAEELAQRIHAVNERGMYILNAARSDEKAREDKTGGQSVFTGAMLGALASERYLVPEAPGRARRAISMLGLIAGLQELLPHYTAQAQVRAQTPVCRMYGDLLPLTIYRT